MSPFRKLLTLVFYLSLVASVNAHDTLQHRDHHNMRRAMLKKRTPLALPQDVGGPVVGAAPLPSVIEPSTTSTTREPLSTTSSSTSLPASPTTSDNKSVSSSTSSLPASISQLSSSSKPPPSASSESPPSSTSTTTDSSGGVSTIIVPGATRTSSVAASESSVIPDKQANTSSSQVKSTTLTVLIAIAASVGGIFILWTIFRKWKLSRSKEFDRRLNPIDWQPTTGEDDQIPGLARRPSVGSLHSSGHGHGATGLSRAPSSHSHSNPFDDFDRPVQQSAPVGGYADLARGPSPTQMQERNQYGPSYNHGAAPLPLHHQGGY